MGDFMINEASNVLRDAKTARGEVITLVDSRFNEKNRRDVIFLLTCAYMTVDFLGGRPRVKEFYEYAVGHQQELLALAHEFDTAITRFNETANKTIPPDFQNTFAVRSPRKLGPSGTIPLFLGNGAVQPKAAIIEFLAGLKAFADQHDYMMNSERAEHDDLLLETIHTTGQWSRLHLDAIDAKHFLATFMIDLYPMMLQRTGRYAELDTDELVRALCESLDSKSDFFRLIREQGWFTEEEFTPGFLRNVGL